VTVAHQYGVELDHLGHSTGTIELF
jgi:hypothetical protein